MLTIAEKLAFPFPEQAINWRVGRAGSKNGKTWAMVLAYIDSRHVMNRLDKVLGINSWQDEYEDTYNGGVRCKLGLLLPDYDNGTFNWVWKSDAADNTQVEATKGGHSDAFKRAAVKFGIGRYLYSLTDNFAKVHDNGRLSGQYKDKQTGKVVYFKYDPPALPDFAKPSGAINAK